LKGIVLKNLVETKGSRAVSRLLGDLLREGKVQPDDFSVQELWEALVGRMSKTLPTAYRKSGFVDVAEAAVDTTAFADIMGQILMSRAMNTYAGQGYIGDRLVDTIHTTKLAERAPGFSLQNDVAEVDEGMPYPESGMGDQYVSFLSGKKRGVLLSITEEAIFRDETGWLLRSAGEVGDYVRADKEGRIINVVTGTTNAYRINGVNTALYATTAASAGGHGNKTAANALVDWTDLDVCLQLIALQRKVDTTTPVSIVPTQMVVPYALFAKASYILHSTEIREVTATTTPVHVRSNPYANMFQLLTSVRLDAISTHTWYLMNGPKAFVYREHWPFQAFRRDRNTEDGFKADIVAQFKFREWGTAEVIDHRWTYQCPGA
jgi:hypothetical protein